MLLENVNKVPALLAYCTFLAIEPNSKRSKDAFEQVQKIMAGNVKKEGNNITMFLDPAMLDDGKGKKKENNFRTIELLFTMSAALDKSKDVDSIAKSAADKLSLKLQLLINSLAEGMKDNKGFYWEHYVPFFVEMKENDFVGTLARLICLSDDNEENSKWAGENETKVNDFYNWLKGYNWK